MSLDAYRSLDASDASAARSYLNQHFDVLVAEAIDEFAFYGPIAVGLAVLVVLELIRMAPDLPQMWKLYFKSWTPLRMVRTSVSGLVALGAVMWAVASWRTRHSQQV